MPCISRFQADWVVRQRATTMRAWSGVPNRVLASARRLCVAGPHPQRDTAPAMSQALGPPPAHGEGPQPRDRRLRVAPRLPGRMILRDRTNPWASSFGRMRCSRRSRLRDSQERRHHWATPAVGGIETPPRMARSQRSPSAAVLRFMRLRPRSAKPRLRQVRCDTLCPSPGPTLD